MTHIVLVKKRALGDSIMGLSGAQYFRELLPHAQITYLVPAWIAPLYKNVKTACDQILPMAEGLGLYSQLLELKPDLIHEMHQSGSTRKIIKAFSFLKRVPYTFHNHHFKGQSPIPDQGKSISVIQRDLDGIFAYYGKIRPDYLNYPPRIEVNAEKCNRVILGTVATRETKMWPLLYFRELYQLLKNDGIEVAIPVGPGDKKVRTELADLDLLNIALEHLPLFFKQSKLYIGNDTGMKHLAVAVGLPTLTFFGPENPNEWHPYDSKKHPYFFKEGLECRTRTSHYCALETCDSMICLNEFKANDVFKAAYRLLESKPTLTQDLSCDLF